MTDSSTSSKATSSKATSTTPHTNNWSHGDLSQYSHFISVDDLPYVSATDMSIGGSIKRHPSWFKVTEIGPPPPDGVVGKKGACHHWLVIQRANMNTKDVQKLLASLVGYPEAKEIGVCGLKDKHAITVQTFSIPSFSRSLARHVTSAELIEKIHQHTGSNLTVIGTPQVSSKKLRRNQHLGNRFEIVVGSLSIVNSKKALEVACNIKDQLLVTGCPNFYGEQRFSRGTSAAIRGQRILERVESSKSGSTRKRLRSSVVRSSHKMLMLSAHSAMYFNLWLANRIRKCSFDKLLDGDLILDTTGPTNVRSQRYSASSSLDEEKERPDGKKNETEGTAEKIAEGHDVLNSTTTTTTTTTTTNNNNNSNTSSTSQLDHRKIVSGFENGVLSFTGPMYGSRMDLPAENTEARAIEDEVAALSKTNESTYRMLNVYGCRRIGRLSIAQMNLNIAEHKEGLVFSFSLPKGSYATAFLREFMKVSMSNKDDKYDGEDSDEEEEVDDGTTDHASSRKRKKARSGDIPRVPLALESIVTTLNELGMEHTIQKINTQPAGTVPKYKMLLLRSTRGKVRKITCVLFLTANPRTIKEWTAVLGEKKTCRLANTKDMEKHLGCSSVEELCPFSVLTSPAVPSHVTVAIDSLMIEETAPFAFKYGKLSRIGLSAGDFVSIATQCGVSVNTVTF